MKFVVALVAMMVLLMHSTRSLSVETKADKKVMVCYYGSWAVYRNGAGKFDVENIDPFVCTHIVYGFAALGWDNTIQPFDPYNDLEDNYGKGAYKRFVGLKEKNPELKALIAIGGWNEGSEKYSKMVSDPAARATFTNSVLDFLALHKFDGLDFDWEYPANRGGIPSDKENFIAMLSELKAAFRPYGYLLTAAVSPGKSTIDSAYDIPSLASILDHIHIMGYDYHGAWDPFTGHNSPLFGNPSIDVGTDAWYNQDFTVKYLIDSGAPPSKLVLGMPTYGRGFTLNEASNNGFYAPANQPIPAGPYSGEPGIWGYNEICEKFSAENDWTIVRDQFYQAPYAFNSKRHWIGYDDMESLKTKAQYAASMNLLGAMVWSLETDDFLGSCHGQTFPLIKTIVETLNGPIVYPTSPTGGSTSITSPGSSTPPTSLVPRTTTKPTGGTPPAEGVCTAPGFFPDPKDCRSFYECVANGNEWTIYYFRCGDGTVFNPAIGQCDFPYNVPGCEDYYKPWKNMAA